MKEKENFNDLKNTDSRFRIISLPFSKEELSEYFGKFDQFQFVIDYKKSITNLGSNTKFLRYLSNCGIVGAYLDNFKLDERLEDLLIEYIKFDQEIILPALSEIWISIVDLHPENSQFFDNNLKEFIDKFRINHKDYIDEINNFFFSLSQALNNIIVPTDTELEKKIINAPKNKLKLCNINIVSLVVATTFYSYITKIKDYAKNILKKPSNNISLDDMVYKFLILQSCAFGGTATWVENNKWKKAGGLRNYWLPTEKSNRKSPVNPMKPMPNSLFNRVKQISNKVYGITGICCDVKDINIEENAIIYIDPPYKGTQDYGFDFDYENFINIYKDFVNIYISEGYKFDNSDECILLSTGRSKGNINGKLKKKPTEEYLNIFYKK